MESRNFGNIDPTIPSMVKLVPLHVQVAVDRFGGIHIELHLEFQLVSMLEVDPARCVRRSIIAAHLRGDVSPN